jgi:heat shock protein HtpX
MAWNHKTGQLQQQALLNTLKSGLLLLGLTILAAAVGYLLLGGLGLLFASVAVVFVAGAGFGVSPRWMMRMAGAVPLPSWSAPDLHQIVNTLARRAGVPSPELYLIPSADANAMTTGAGRERGALAVTEGLLHLLRKEELEGVVAHEIAHLRNRDTTILQVAGFVSQTVLTLIQVSVWIALFSVLIGGLGLSRLLVLSLLALAVPVAVSLLQTALSRTREFAADAKAAQLTGRPWALASALRKLARQRTSWASLFFRRPTVPPLLRSHPPTGDRIHRLEALGSRQRPKRIISHEFGCPEGAPC